MASERFYVYILTNRANGTLYTGMTNDLFRRVSQHRSAGSNGFTKRYGTNRLVWFESTSDPRSAIAREKQIKKWRRAWKIELIEKMNPGWRDLLEESA